MTIQNLNNIYYIRMYHSRKVLCNFMNLILVNPYLLNNYYIGMRQIDNLYDGVIEWISDNLLRVHADYVDKQVGSSKTMVYNNEVKLKVIVIEFVDDFAILEVESSEPIHN